LPIPFAFACHPLRIHKTLQRKAFGRSGVVLPERVEANEAVRVVAVRSDAGR